MFGLGVCEQGAVMTATPQQLVERFYAEVWNQHSATAAREILADDFRFRGSLGPEHRGPEGFIGYMHAVHDALAEYTCVIEHLVVGEGQVAAKMRFHGIHQAPFFGIEATGKRIEWAGAAFFKMRGGQIAELWVLGDIDSVKQQLGADGQEQFS